MALPEGEAEASQPRALAAQVASREGLIVLACVLTMAALAWWWLVGQEAEMAALVAAPMDGMAMDGMAMDGMAMPPPAKPFSVPYSRAPSQCGRS